jgi:hypothetical protein
MSHWLVHRQTQLWSIRSMKWITKGSARHVLLFFPVHYSVVYPLSLLHDLHKRVEVFSHHLQDGPLNCDLPLGLSRAECVRLRTGRSLGLLLTESDQ